LIDPTRSVLINVHTVEAPELQFRCRVHWPHNAGLLYVHTLWHSPRHLDWACICFVISYFPRH